MARVTFALTGLAFFMAAMAAVPGQLAAQAPTAAQILARAQAQGQAPAPGPQPPAPVSIGTMSPRRITIPFLANAVKQSDLDFMGADCEVAGDNAQMTCRFRQVFLTTPPNDATLCMITTGGYEQTFHRDTPVRWVARAGPAGVCGVVETTTLEDGGGTHWSMTIRTAATANTERPECRAVGTESEAYDYKNVKRKLPCTFVQPGGIER